MLDYRSMTEVAGIKIETLSPVISQAVSDYQELSYGLPKPFNGNDQPSPTHQLKFRVKEAGELKLTPDKPNSARSVTMVTDYAGRLVGNLFVIAFKPEDGTGDESSYKVSQFTFEGYPQTAKTLPRDKTGIHTEVYLPLLSHYIEDVHAEPVIFGGHLDLLGLDARGGSVRVVKKASLGSPATGEQTAHPLYTTSYRDRHENRGRFGDPHAIYNSNQDSLVVAGFLALSEELYKQTPGLIDSLESLRPTEPLWIK